MESFYKAAILKIPVFFTFEKRAEWECSKKKNSNNNFITYLILLKILSYYVLLHSKKSKNRETEVYYVFNKAGAKKAVWKFPTSKLKMQKNRALHPLYEDRK